jgi:hypothetical protein
MRSLSFNVGGGQMQPGAARRQCLEVALPQSILAPFRERTR